MITNTWLMKFLNQIKIACDDAEVAVPHILQNLDRLLLVNLVVLYTKFYIKKNKMIGKLEHD